MTTLAPLVETPVYTIGGWVANATDVYGCDWIVEKEKGWSASPTAVSEAVDLAFDDGEDAGSVYYRARYITLSGVTLCPDQTEMVRAKDRFAAACLARGGDLLVVEEEHITRQAWVRRDGQSNVEDVGNAAFRWDLTLRARDPRKYANALTEIPPIALDPALTAAGLTFPLTFPLDFGASQYPSRATLVNEGTYRTPMRAVFYGPYTSPGLTSETSGRSLEFDIALAAGETLVIDTSTRDVLLNGTSSRLYTIQPGSRWWHLEPGSNDVRVQGSSSGTGRVDLSFRSAWM
jgi:hypothetical protein